MHSSLYALIPLTFLLGMKHGLDADHLAAIDAITRFNAADRPRLARRAGAFFALGHGVVMLCVSLAVSKLASDWQLPNWLLSAGTWVSIGVLAYLGALNLRAALTKPDLATGFTGIAGLRTGWLGRLLRTSSPLAVMGVGAVFAISFDTVGQAALMAAAVKSLGGWPQAMLLTAVFVAGMCSVDSLNGLWTARLVRRSTEYGAAASRFMAGCVGVLGLLTAAYGMASQVSPDIDVWSEGKETWMGVAFLVCVGSAFFVGKTLTRRKTRDASAA
jgi:high-affinity nickel-transport protein